MMLKNDFLLSMPFLSCSHNLIIYGTGTFGRYMINELTENYISKFNLLCACASKEYVDSELFKCSDKSKVKFIPYYGFDEIEKYCPPDVYSMLVVYGGNNMQARTDAFINAQKKGYQFASYVHKSAVYHGDKLFGRNVIIYENCTIDSNARLGDNVMVRPNTYVGHDSCIGDNTFIAPGCNIAGYSNIDSECFIGMGSNIVGVNVGFQSIIGSGSVLMKDCPSKQVWYGVPAKKIKDND